MTGVERFQLLTKMAPHLHRKRASRGVVSSLRLASWALDALEAAGWEAVPADAVTRPQDGLQGPLAGHLVAPAAHCCTSTVTVPADVATADATSATWARLAGNGDHLRHLRQAPL